METPLPSPPTIKQGMETALPSPPPTINRRRETALPSPLCCQLSTVNCVALSVVEGSTINCLIVSYLCVVVPAAVVASNLVEIAFKVASSASSIVAIANKIAVLA